MKYRQVYHDGCNGFRLGKVVELEPNEAGEVVLPADEGDEDEEGSGEMVFSSRNNDGLLENEEGDELLVPIS